MDYYCDVLGPDNQMRKVRSPAHSFLVVCIWKSDGTSYLTNEMLWVLAHQAVPTAPAAGLRLEWEELLHFLVVDRQ
jgi:hypothetical protein